MQMVTAAMKLKEIKIKLLEITKFLTLQEPYLVCFWLLFSYYMQNVKINEQITPLTKKKVKHL